MKSCMVEDSCDSSFVTINKTLELLEFCDDASTIQEKLYLLVNVLTNSDIKYPSKQNTEDCEKYRNILAKIYGLLHNRDGVIVLLIAQLYVRRLKGYIPFIPTQDIAPPLTENFIGPIALQNLVFTASAIKKGITSDYLTNDLKLNTSTVFNWCDYWLSFNFNNYNVTDMATVNNKVFLEIVAVLDCENMIDTFELSAISSLEKFLLVKMIRIMITDSNLVSQEFNRKLVKCYGKLCENEFLLHYSNKLDAEIETKSTSEMAHLVFNMIPIMELLDHPEEHYINNEQFLNFLSDGLTSLVNFLSTGDALNIIKVHEVLSNRFMKSKLSLITVLEIAKTTLIFYTMELLDDIHFSKFAKLLPLTFYKDILANLPTLTKHDIWNMPANLNTFETLGNKFTNINFCICLLQKLITATWDCYNSLQVSIEMDFNLHKLFATGKFIELFYFKQLTYTLSAENTDSFGCYDHLLLDSYRRLIFENCIESQVSIFTNWNLALNNEACDSKEFLSFLKFIVINIWNEHPSLKLITKSLIVDVFFSKLAKINPEFKQFLSTNKFAVKSLSVFIEKPKQSDIKNVKLTTLLKSLVTEEEDLDKLEELISEMKNNNNALVQTSKRLSLKPNLATIYSTPAKFNTRTSPTQQKIDLSFKDLKLETDNLSFSNLSPQSAIIHNIASQSEISSKNPPFGRKMSTHVDSFI